MKLTGVLASLPRRQLWLFACISLAVLPHSMRNPLWVTAGFTLLCCWKLLIAGAMRRLRFLALLAKLLVAAAIVSGTILTYGTLVGRDAGIALLILLIGMKFLETRNQRDFYITAFIGMFLLLTNFLYSQTIPAALYMLLVVLVFVCTLIAENDTGDSLPVRARIYVAGSMVLQALPFMLILFVLFPRVPGPIWGLPRDARAAASGVDDEMEPGSISSLILSREIAFRVEFSGALPERKRLYWRGPVLWQTDGVKWFRGRPRAYRAEVAVTGEPVAYTVTLEPTEQNWLYGLELPAQAPVGGVFTGDLQIQTQAPVRNRRRYELTSYTDFRIFDRSDGAIADALQLPAGYHGRAVALGRSWRAQGLDDRQIVNTALRLFNEQEFYYTTTPPPLLQDTIDQFLFETRQGFCEHYAAAFAVMMRAAGIPTRVVTGYQGGTVNPIDGFLVVRQYDAHAWTEVYLRDDGWTRVDPTAAIAPSRILRGTDEALPAGLLPIPAGLRNNAAVRTAWLRMRDTLDAVNNRWNQWILSYDDRQQMLLLARLGMENIHPRMLGIALVLILLAVFAGVYLWLFRRRAGRVDQARRLYDLFCGRLARLGLVRAAHEGPMDFASRVRGRRGDLDAEIDTITRLYIETRYGDRAGQLEFLQRRVRNFRPARAPA
jgi:transglutaminase-like putative cysteine protease